MTVESLNEDLTIVKPVQHNCTADSPEITMQLQNETSTLLSNCTNNIMQNGTSIDMNFHGNSVPSNKNNISNEDGPDLSKKSKQTITDRLQGDEALEQVQREEDWDDYELETKCGFGPCHPQWLQKLASKKSYVLVYGLIGMIDFAIGSYFVSTISTIEKRFKIPSRTSGLISSAWDIGGVSSSLMISYLGSRGHKTRWVSCGTLLVGLSCFLLLVPHLIFGPGQDALELTLEYGAAYELSNYNNNNNTSIISGDSKAFVCQSEYLDEEDCSVGSFSSIPSTIFFFSFFIAGVGCSMYYTLGVSYLDDNVRKNKTPFLLAITMCIRMLGPTIGYLYGSFSLKQYVDPTLHPTITSDDPRWIGAWWHAWGPFGIVCILLATTLALFPKRLPRAAQRTIAAGENTGKRNVSRSFTDFKMVVSRLARNKVLIFNSFSSVFFMFGLIGYWTFMPKYMETQFRQSASTASLITGSVGLIFSALGIMVSGAIISKFKPRPRYLAAWNVMVESLDVAGHFSYGFLSCSIDDLYGSMNPDHSWNLTAACNSDCDCGPAVKYSPVCATDGSNTFYSACHAGCTTLEMINGTKMYGNCSCIGTEGMGWAVDGACPVDCTKYFAIFLVIQCTLRFFSASGRAGNMIIQFRCVDQDDKSVSIGFTEALLCALAFIPGPILYGTLLDSACIVWGQTCGKSGNCWLYDGQRLGFLLNFTASAFLLGGTLLDIGVWYNVRDLQIYDKEDDNRSSKELNKTNENKINSQSKENTCENSLL